MELRRVRAPWLIVVGADAAVRAEVVRALGVAHGEHLQVGSLTDIPGNALTGPAVILVLAVDDPVRSPLPAARAFRNSDLVTPLVLWMISGIASWQRASVYARGGFDEILTGEPEDRAVRYLRHLRRRADLALPRAAIHSFDLRRLGRTREFVAYCARNAYRNLTVADTATWFGVSAETLNRRLRKAGLPRARDVIRLTHFLYVAHELEHAEYLSVAARRLGYPTSRHLGMFLHRAIGLSSRELRDAGGLAFALRYAASKLMSD
jgi:AraC-like DNA-binding protein